MTNNNSLKQRTISGIFWNFMEQFFSRGVGIGTTLILAWFLLPEDFGLIAMISVFFAIANSIMDSGFSQALIRKKKDVSQTDYSTAFYTNLGLGLLDYALLFAAAPSSLVFMMSPGWFCWFVWLDW